MLWCGVVWCGVVWCGVVWCGVVWCGVVWCGGNVDSSKWRCGDKRRGSHGLVWSCGGVDQQEFMVAWCGVMVVWCGCYGG